MSGTVPLILSETPLRRFRPFGGRTQPRAGVAQVVVTEREEYLLLKDRRTHGELGFAPHARLYEVDVAHHRSTLAFALKSANDGYDFTATAEITWQVADPVKIVRDGVAEGTEAITHHARTRMLAQSRRHDIDQYRALEDAINAEFGSERGRTLNGCLLLHSFWATISLDEAGKEWLRARGAAQREGELIRETHGVDLAKQRYELELEAQRKRHDLELAALQAKFELEAKRHEHELELARQRKEEYQRLDLERARANAIAEAMERGDAAVLAAHFGRHPDDTKDIVRMIIEQKGTVDERRWTLLSQMINQGMIIGADLEEYRSELARTARDLLASRPDSVFALTKILDIPLAELAQQADASIPSSQPPEDAAASSAQSPADAAGSAPQHRAEAAPGPAAAQRVPDAPTPRAPTAPLFGPEPGAQTREHTGSRTEVPPEGGRGA